MSEGEMARVYASGSRGLGTRSASGRVYPSGLMRASPSSCELITSGAGRAGRGGVSALGSPPWRLQVHGGRRLGPRAALGSGELAPGPHCSGSLEVWVTPVSATPT